jgi:hypothetical protein
MQCACAVIYCHLWPLQLYHIFPHYLTNGTIFGEKVVETKQLCVLISPTNLSEIFLIPRKTERDVIINAQRSSCKVAVILVRF